MIYFDNAATSYPKPDTVARAMGEALAGFGNPGRSAHAFSLAAARCVALTRERIARLFGCTASDRVAFTKNATEALNIAVNSLDGHIVVSAAEHNSVLRPVHRRGDYSVAPLDERGRLAVAAVEQAVRRDTAAVVIAHASNLTGNTAPIEDIGRLCRARGILLIVDAAQTAGLFPIDMEAMHIDALCFTGHKGLYGPQGTGGICLGQRFHPRALLFGGGDGDSFEAGQPGDLPGLLEAGTANAHGIAGLAAGLAYVTEHSPEALLARADALARTLHSALADDARITFYGDYQATRRAPIVALNVGDLPSDEAAHILAEKYDMAVRSGVHCAPLLHRHFGTEKRGMVRFSFSQYNTEQEVALAIAALRELSR